MHNFGGLIMIYLNGLSISPTIFPDGTSQVWKLDESNIYETNNYIEWFWEGNESELIWVNQLICLLYQNNAEIGNLYMPYLPYGRQDKDVTNFTTFSKHVFLELLLKEHVKQLTTLDAHSSHPSIVSYGAIHFILEAINRFKANVLVFPDSGAITRYSDILDEVDIPYIVFDKVRDQLTGNITGMQVSKKSVNFIDGSDYQMLIIDDICDGGMTYIKLAEYIETYMKDFEVSFEMALYVTHGIFSKGTDVIYDAGIKSIYTTDSLEAFRNKNNSIVRNYTLIYGDN